MGVCGPTETRVTMRICRAGQRYEVVGERELVPHCRRDPLTSGSCTGGYTSRC